MSDSGNIYHPVKNNLQQFICFYPTLSRCICISMTHAYVIDVCPHTCMYTCIFISQLFHISFHFHFLFPVKTSCFSGAGIGGVHHCGQFVISIFQRPKTNLRTWNQKIIEAEFKFKCYVRTKRFILTIYFFITLNQNIGFYTFPIRMLKASLLVQVTCKKIVLYEGAVAWSRFITNSSMEGSALGLLT